MSRFYKYMIGSLIFIQFLYVVFGLLNNRLATGDAYSIWFLKAKVLNFDGWGSHFIFFLKDKNYSYSHPEYPLLWPLFLSFFGRSDYVYMWTYPLLLILSLVITYKIIMSFTDQNIALCGVLGLITVIVIERMAGINEVGYADLPLALGYLSSFYFLMKDQNSLYLGILLGLLGLIKMEGFLGMILFLIVYKPKNKLIYFWAITPSTLWWGLTKVLGLTIIYQQNINIDYLLSHWSSILTIIKLLVSEVLNLKKYGFWLIILLLSFSFQSLDTKVQKLKFWIVSYLFLLAFSYSFSPMDIILHWNASFYRIIAQVLPLIVVVGMSTFEKIKPFDHRKRLPSNSLN